MSKPNKIEKAIGMTLMRMASFYKPRLSTRLAVHFYRRWGMNFTGIPNYISSLVAFDGTDYGLIEIGEGVTISSYIRVLTHDWSPNTIISGMGATPESPIGRTGGVRFGHHCFIGTGSIIMPGCDIGHCSVIGAGTVVRGKIPPYSIVIGSPGRHIGDTREYIERKFPEFASVAKELMQQAEQGG